MAPTGTVIDRLILTPVESVWDAHGIAHEHEAGEAHEELHHHDHDEDGHEADGHEHGPANLTARGELKPEITALLVSYRSSFGAVRIPSMINRQTEMQAAVPATETARLLNLLGIGIDSVRMFAWLLAFTGGLSIFVALLNAAQAREGDLALLRVMGASRGSVFGVILAEGLITAAAGALLGLVIGHGAMAIAVSRFSQLSEIGIDPWRFFPGELAIVLGVFAIGLLAAFIPALRVFPAAVKALNGKTIKVAGWMMPLDNGRTQKRWVRRSLSRFRYHNAESFFESLGRGFYDRSDEMLYQSGMVAQLALSAHLLDVGFSDAWNARHIRLDVGKGLAYANATGFAHHCPDMTRLTAVLSPYWKWGHVHRFGKPRPDDGAFTIEEVRTILRALLDRAHDVTGHPRPNGWRRCPDRTRP